MFCNYVKSVLANHIVIILNLFNNQKLSLLQLNKMLVLNNKNQILCGKLIKYQEESFYIKIIIK